MSEQAAADTILTNGHIATLAPASPFVSALAVRGGAIVAAGADGEIAAELSYPV